MTDYGAPFTGSIQKVRDEWIDYNGHFNMAYYAVLFDQCVDEAFALIGLGADYVKETNCSYFTLQAHINYLRELHASDSVRITVQLLDHDAKRLHYIQQMFHADEGWLATTLEAVAMHVDMGAKRSSPFPDDMLKKIAAMHEAHSAVPPPEHAGRPIGLKRKSG